MQEAAVASNLLGTMAIFQFIAVIAMIPLCIRFGPAPSYRMVVVLFGLSSLSYALLYYAGLSDVYSLLLLISAVAGLGRGGINYVPWNTYTYIADVDEAITGQRREGIFAGIMTLTRKASQAGAVMLVGIIMQLSGFVSGQKIQPEGVSHTILLILSVGTGGVSLRLPRLAALQAQPAHPQRPAQRDPQNARARLRSVGTDQCGTPRGGRAAGGDALRLSVGQ